MSKKLLTVLSLASVLFGVVAAATLTQMYFPNTGEITVLEIYLDNTLYSNGTAIDWGPCEPDNTYYFENMTVINKGEVTLQVTIIPYNLPSDWILMWQHNNTVITTGTMKSGELNLTIPASATTWPEWGFYLNGEET